MSERDELDSLYQRLNSRDPRRPPAEIHRAVLEEAGRRAAAYRRATLRDALIRGLRGRVGLIQVRSAWPVAGSLIAATLAFVMILPQLRTPTPGPETPSAPESARTPAPSPAPSPAPASAPAAAPPPPAGSEPLAARSAASSAAPPASPASPSAFPASPPSADARQDSSPPPEPPFANAIVRDPSSAAAGAAPSVDVRAAREAARAQTADALAPAPSPPQVLWRALESGDAAALQRALEAGASLEIRDPAGHTPLLFAIERRDLAAVRLLLDHGADPDAADLAGRSPLALARTLGLGDIVAALQAAGARGP